MFYFIRLSENEGQQRCTASPAKGAPRGPERQLLQGLCLTQWRFSGPQTLLQHPANRSSAGAKKSKKLAYGGLAGGAPSTAMTTDAEKIKRDTGRKNTKAQLSDETSILGSLIVLAS